jgi:hypothetical protein
MRGGKGQGRKAKLAATENMPSRTNGLDQGVLLMTWLAINRFAVRKNYANNFGAVRDLCNSYGHY